MCWYRCGEEGRTTSGGISAGYLTVDRRVCRSGCGGSQSGVFCRECGGCRCGRGLTRDERGACGGWYCCSGDCCGHGGRGAWLT